MLAKEDEKLPFTGHVISARSISTSLRDLYLLCLGGEESYSKQPKALCHS